MEKKLGKISSTHFGLGGYQGACLGLHLAFTMDGSGVGTSIDWWDVNMIEWSDRSEWTEETRSAGYDGIMRKLSDILHAAKVDDVSKLVGIPVELTFEGNTLKDWRVLREVL